jgi:hypothetical protein
MEFFKSFISIMAYASLGFSFAAAYLKINKIWKRKHIEEVASSVSIMGNVLDIIPLTIFSLNFLLVAQWQGLIDSVLWIVAGVVSVLIGSGLWVQSNRGKSFWTRLMESLKLEKSEVGHLATSFFRPSAAEVILDILARFAYIDQELADREKELIQSFANTWQIDINWEEHRNLADLDQSVGLVKTRDTVARYLNTSPPAEQVAQLIEVLHSLVKIDENVSDQEELILEEVQKFMRGYIDGTDVQANYTVVIAPQNRDQDAAIAALLPDVQKIEIAGGSGYLVGSFYSQDYADVICDQYRALGFFTIDLMGDAVVIPSSDSAEFERS